MTCSLCRSRILTLDGARYSITERKGGMGYVRDLIPFLSIIFNLL
jgi:hypothetical protein